jgi:hypothetical protein
MTEQIEIENIQKPKRTYVRKPKVVSPNIEQECVTTGGLGVSPNTGGLGVSPNKRTYARKTKIEPKIEIEIEPKIELKIEPKIEPKIEIENIQEPKIKKPRTEKQIMAFNKMREARYAKQDELNELKIIDQENKAEYNKLNRLTEKVLRKSNAPKYTEPPISVSYNIEPPNIIQEPKVKEYIFV